MNSAVTTPNTLSTSPQSKPLKMVGCGGCAAKVFISSDLPPFGTVACTKCGHPVMMPVMMRQFELRQPIASGGMGTVYRAFDTALHREVAVKLMRKDFAEDPKSLESFYREARACASLNHTNIIHIYTFEEHESQRFLVMELADRGSLDGRIDKEKVLPELDVLDIGIKVASALATALKHGLLHRDIKPGNILFNADGEPKLVDFGLALRAGEQSDEENAVWGTPEYIAPEKVTREGEDFLSDMYSLAATLYHALTGHVPFQAPTIEEIISAQVHTPLTPPHLVVPSITTATSDAIAAALAKKPADRFKSYDDFSMALTASRSQLLVSQLRMTQQGGGGGGGGGRRWWR